MSDAAAAGNTSPDLDLDAHQAGQAGRHLAGVGEQLSSLRKAAGAEIEGVNDTRPWGRDELGAAFAAAYAQPAAQLLRAWNDVAERTIQLGEEIIESTVSTIETDSTVAQAIDRIRELP